MLDHPKTRAGTDCPFCNDHKPVGLVACWPCFRAEGLRNGDPLAEAALARFEASLAEGE